jgi:hypothetical protein
MNFSNKIEKLIESTLAKNKIPTFCQKKDIGPRLFVNYTILLVHFVN